MAGIGIRHHSIDPAQGQFLQVLRVIVGFLAHKRLLPPHLFKHPGHDKTAPQADMLAAQLFQTGTVEFALAHKQQVARDFQRHLHEIHIILALRIAGVGKGAGNFGFGPAPDFIFQPHPGQQAKTDLQFGPPRRFSHHVHVDALDVRTVLHHIGRKRAAVAQDFRRQGRTRQHAGSGQQYGAQD